MIKFTRSMESGLNSALIFSFFIPVDNLDYPDQIIGLLPLLQKQVPVVQQVTGINDHISAVYPGLVKADASAPDQAPQFSL